ncbi:MAG: hypothetical protein SGI88_20335 [Candidatus Hydrogenedentes bacterium]|nr:hypothetical protein [Candidatus Hydrogenedentota bacterium]
MGTLIERVHRELTTEDVAKIVDPYHAWRSDLSSIGSIPSIESTSSTKSTTYADSSSIART